MRLLGSSVREIHTFSPQSRSPLINERLLPTSEGIHDVHVVFSLCRKARDSFAADDRLASPGVNDAWEDRASVAPEKVRSRSQMNDP